MLIIFYPAMLTVSIATFALTINILLSLSYIVILILSDFLILNIGNSNDDFTPSKTFEYIATGKPIVNFYYGKEPDNILSSA